MGHGRFAKATFGSECVDVLEWELAFESDQVWTTAPEPVDFCPRPSWLTVSERISEMLRL